MDLVDCGLNTAAIKDREPLIGNSSLLLNGGGICAAEVLELSAQLTNR
jgi:predicted outer membrane repeat protein